MRCRKPHQDDDALCAGAGILAWRLGLLDLAVLFGENAVKLSRDDNYKFLRNRLNVIYYKTDMWRNEYLEDPIKLVKKLTAIKPEVNGVLEREPEWNKGVFVAGKHNTLAYYFFSLAEVEDKIGNRPQAVKDIEKAIAFNDKCFLQWRNKEMHFRDMHDRWKAHSLMIKALAEKFGIYQKQ